MTYKGGDFVRLRYGCVWLYAQIDKICGDGWYEVSYGTKKRFDKLKDGWSFDYFCHALEEDLKPINT